MIIGCIMFAQTGIDRELTSLDWESDFDLHF